MASYGYSATTEHVAEHQAFVEKVGEFARKYDEGNVALSIEVIDFLRAWLTAHILRSDKIMVKELLAKGAA